VSTLVLTDVTTWVGSYDMTTDLNQVALQASVEEKDSTTFGSGGWRTRKGGLRDVTANLSGLWSGGDDGVDAEAFAHLGESDRVMTISPDGAAGSPAYFFQGGTFSYEAFDAVGELAPFSLSARATNAAGLIRGRVAAPKGAVAAPGAVGSPVTLGAVPADRFVYCAIHVFEAGTTLTLKLQSDDAASFASPTDLATLPALTAAGGTWVARIPGPLTDSVFRLTATAVTGSFTLAASIGSGA
jgi:hypothetical protein